MKNYKIGHFFVIFRFQTCFRDKMYDRSKDFTDGSSLT